jgi:hypothetical protein
VNNPEEMKKNRPVPWKKPGGLFLHLSILCLVFLGLVSGCHSSDQGASDMDDPVEQLVVLSPPGQGYPDPEILQEESLMTFQTGDGTLWLARLDPVTGTFISEWGKDVLIDTGGAPLSVTHNGSEFGLNASGWTLYYARGNALYSQIWQATVSGEEVHTEQLTNGPMHNNQLATKNPGSTDSVKILCVRTDSGREEIIFFPVTNPTVETFVTAHDQQNIPVRWAQGGQYICLRTEEGQLCLLDTWDQTRIPVSNDTGSKTDPNGWFAPEYNGELLIAAVLDHRSIAVYRDSGQAFWNRIFTLEIPGDTNLDRMASPEPFVFGGRSYLSLTIKDSQGGPAEIWIMSIDGTYQEKCGDGSPLKRADPEVYIGLSHVFVYYYLIPSLELRRWKCRLSG